MIKAICDGAYDSRFNFTFLEERGIESAIKVRKNSLRRARGCPARKRVVMEYLQDPEARKRRVGYGLRWMAETAFSTFKRLFGEHVRARTLPNMIREMLLKARLYNLFTSLNPAPGAVHAWERMHLGWNIRNKRVMQQSRSACFVRAQVG